MSILALGLVFQTLASAAYQFPGGLVFAPGQVIPIIVTGLPPLPSRVQAQQVPLPSQLAGISVALNQTLPDRSWQLPIFAIEQNRGLTAITVEIPYDISVPNPYVVNIMAQPSTTLTITGGSVVQAFTASPVYDRVHILQSCDINGVTENTGVCYPLVTHASGALVLENARLGDGTSQTHTEALPGETLVMYAYGLGVVTPSVTPGTPSPVPPARVAGPIFMRYDYAPDAAPSPAEIASTPDSPLFAGLAPGQVGLYQINFQVPQPPTGTLPCGLLGQSNLTVSVTATGSDSFDGARLCVDTGTALP